MWRKSDVVIFVTVPRNIFRCVINGARVELKKEERRRAIRCRSSFFTPVFLNSHDSPCARKRIHESSSVAMIPGKPRFHKKNPRFPKKNQYMPEAGSPGMWYLLLCPDIFSGVRSTAGFRFPERKQRVGGEKGSPGAEGLTNRKIF